MPSSRLFEMLAEARAKPSGAFQGAMSAINAGNEVATSAYDYAKNKRLDTKLSSLLGDPTYGDMTLRDVADKDSGLFELLKIKQENAAQDTIGPVDPSDPTKGLVSFITGKPVTRVGRHTRIISPGTNINLRGEELYFRKTQARINNLQKAQQAIRRRIEQIAPFGTPMDEGQYKDLQEQDNFISEELSNLGIRTSPSKPKTIPTEPTVASPIGVPTETIIDGSNRAAYDALPSGGKYTYKGKTYTKK